MLTNNIIDTQQVVADEVLKMLKPIDPHAILAGGAPRDWFFEKSAKDLDFYVHLPRETVLSNQTRFKSVGLNGLEPISYERREGMSKEERELRELRDLGYLSMECLQRVFEGTILGQKVQIMVINESTFNSVIESMSCSICKFYYRDHTITPSTEALLGIWHEFNILGEGYKMDHPHVKKIKGYFPEYDLVGNGCIEVLTKIAAKNFGIKSVYSEAFKHRLHEEVIKKMLERGHEHG